jgi:hypothetical protein
VNAARTGTKLHRSKLINAECVCVWGGGGGGDLWSQKGKSVNNE